MIYCDYNAGAPLRPEARAAMLSALDAGGNASSVHGVGRRARAILEDVREQIAASVSARSENVIFTSGASEAIHLALDSFGVEARLGARSSPCVIVSAGEHDAVFQHASAYASLRAPLTASGVIDLTALELLLREAAKPALLAVQLANNETGVVQPIAGVAALAREHRALLMVDAAQAFGKIPVDICDLDASYLMLSSHKIGGPSGAGALVLAPGAPFKATRFGGGQERGRRPGTENVPAIAGFGAAAASAIRELERERERISALRDLFEAQLPHDVVVFGRDAQRLPNTSNFALTSLAAETAVIALDLAGVAVSSGAACSSGKVRQSRVLEAMGVAPHLMRAALRISFGWSSTPSDVAAASAAIAHLAQRRTRREVSIEGAASCPP